MSDQQRQSTAGNRACSNTTPLLLQLLLSPLQVLRRTTANYDTIATGLVITTVNISMQENKSPHKHSLDCLREQRNVTMEWHGIVEFNVPLDTV